MERKNPIVLPETKAGADHNRFLTDARVHAAAHLALTHAEAEPLVEGPDELEPVVDLEQLVGAEFEFGSLDRRACFGGRHRLLSLIQRFMVVREQPSAEGRV